MRALAQTIRFAISAALWRKSDPGLSVFRLPLLAGLTVALLGNDILCQWLSSGSDASFALYGINASIAMTAAIVCVAALFSARFERLEETSVVVCLLVLVGLTATGVSLGWGALKAWGDDSESWKAAAAWAEFAAFWLYIAWLVGAIRRVFADWENSTGRHPLMRAVGVVCGLYIAAYALPLSPVFRSSDFDRRTANIWEMLSAYREAQRTTADGPKTYVDRWAAVELAQPALLEGSLRKLGVRQPNTSNVFVLGVAGWAEQGVFLREASESLAVLDQRFGTGFRTMLLANSEETRASTPIASLPNLAAALTEIGRQMDREHDALILVLTSHGSPSGFALQYPPMVRRLLNGDDLKAALDAAGIKNRIVIVSACYSGTFVPALADENTAIFTAASAETTSFGCSDERDWTYFGDAFFNRALRQGGTLTSAFAEADATIRSWEERDRLTPSKPQTAVGAAIAALLPDLVGSPGATGHERQASAAQ